MWIIAMFDLPTDTKEEKKAYVNFRKSLLQDGFTMMQYSVYMRHCASIENAQVHMDRMGKCVPDDGEVRFLMMTDKQFARIVSFTGRKRQKPEEGYSQLMLL